MPIYFLVKLTTSFLYQEYDSLTQKIHELQQREEQLEQLITEETEDYNPEDSQDQSYYATQTYPSVGTFQTQLSDSTTDSVLSQYSSPLTPNIINTPPHTAQHTPWDAPNAPLGSPSPVPKSPLKGVVKAYLPHHQKTTVSQYYLLYEHQQNK